MPRNLFVVPDSQLDFARSYVAGADPDGVRLWRCVMTRGRGLDYLPCEIEALAFLATGTMLANWHSFFGSPEPADDLWVTNAELAQEWLCAHRLEQQRNKACRMLFLRGLVERRKFPGEGGGWFYRLLPVVTGDARANP